MADRRDRPRRVREASSPEGEKRRRDRRRSERRHSHRVMIAIRARPQGTGKFAWYLGNLSTGGVRLTVPPGQSLGEVVDLAFKVPGEDELLLVGNLLRMTDAEEHRYLHLRFCELELEQELAIAGFLDRNRV